MRAEDKAVEFSSPSLLIVPSGIVHGFRWHWESRGSVITFADSYLHDLVRRDAYVNELLRTPRTIELGAEDLTPLERDLAALSKELGTAAPGYHAAVDSTVLSIAVTALRRAQHLTDAGSNPADTMRRWWRVFAPASRSAIAFGKACPPTQRRWV